MYQKLFLVLSRYEDQASISTYASLSNIILIIVKFKLFVMIQENQLPEEISEHFGKLRLISNVLFNIAVGFESNNPTMFYLLREFSRSLTSAISDTDSYIDQLINPDNYVQN